MDSGKGRAMPKQSAKDMYERISDYVDLYSRKYYGGAQEQGFRHWAFAELFLEHDLSDTDIVTNTAIDGPDDLEVDGYYVEDSEEEKTVHLFQSKHRTPGSTLGNKELAPFAEAPGKLLNQEMVAACRNEETKALHDILIDLLPKGYSLRLVWVTSGTLSPQARRYAQQKASETMSVVIDGKAYDVQASFEAYDLRDLVALFQSHLESDDVSDTSVDLKVPPGMCHSVSAGFNTIQLTIPAKQIIEIRRKSGYKIYRLNPRGPLGNKTNTQIKETLRDETLRGMFHLLNNGLSAICDSYTLSGSSLRVRNLLIVNGCQTTETLWSVRALVENDPKVLVNVKLIECPQHLHGLIARTTNTQAPLRAEDFISTDPIQIELQKQFDSLPSPWFYQIKRSEWSRMTLKADKRRYLEADGSYRWVKSKDVAQAYVAFLGFPGEAKDKIRFFFEGRLASEYGEISYKDIYSEGLSATQLLLPAILYRKVNSEVDRDRVANNLDWLDYARLHLLWLIGELLRNNYRVPRNPFPKGRSHALSESVDSWFLPLYQVARASISIVVSEAQQTGTYRGHREFFRTPGNYRFIVEKLPLAVEFARSAGLDVLEKLPTM
jgi:hypothetical protein